MSDTSLQALAQTAPVRRVVSHAARVRNLDPTRPITDVIQAVSGYLATRQQCQTERVRIDAELTRDLARYAELHARAMAVINHSFAERALLFPRLLDALDTALAADNLPMVRLMLEAITAIAADNPVQKLRDEQGQWNL